MKENQEGRAAVLMKKVNPLMKKCKPIPLSDKYPKNVEKISAADDERSVCSCDEVVQVMPLMIKRMLMEKVGDSQKNLTEAAQVCEEDKTQSSEEQKKILLSRQINVTSLKSQQLDLKGECILRSPADSDAFQSGRCAEHNGCPETPIIVS